MEERLWWVSRQYIAKLEAHYKYSEVFLSIQKPDSIVDACQALSKARELRAQFEKKEKPLITAKVEIQITRLR